LKNFSFQSKKNLQIRSEELGRRKTQKGRTGKKKDTEGKNIKEKKNKTSSVNSSNSLSVVQRPSTPSKVTMTTHL
jgi:hypothetical protein